MNRSLSRSQIFLASVAVLVVAFPTTGSADIIDDHVEAVGGESAIANLETIKRSGKFTITIAGNIDSTGTIEQAIVVGKKGYRKEVNGGGTKEAGWNGDVAWTRDPKSGLRKVEGTDSDFIAAQLVAGSAVETYREHGRDVFREEPMKMFGDKNCHVLHVVDTGLYYFIDPDTKLLAGSAILDVGFVTRNSDYDRFGGVMMPKRQRLDIAGGAITMDSEYDKIEVGIPLDDSIFDMPAE